MTALEQINRDLAAITDDMVANIAGYLPPLEKDDKPLGVIASIHARRLWVLAVDYQRESMQLVFNALYDSDSADRPSLKQRSKYLDSLADIVRDMAWLEMRQEVGEDAWTGEISLREGFMLAASKNESPVQAVVQGISVTGVINDLLSRLVDARAEKRPEKERKPQ